MFSRRHQFWMVISLASLLPLFWVLFDIFFDRLGPNAIQSLHIRTGDWALRFLCLTLLITPLQNVTKWKGMAEFRQMLGLYAFFYATLHVLGYLFVDHAGVWEVIVIDVIESSYILFGLLAYLIILLLAITSPTYAKKRMGKNWKKLHRFIYYAAVASIIHYFWQLKGNLFQPLFYLTIIAFLLGFRAVIWYRNRQMARLMIPKWRSVSEEDSE